jgi:hypothetical protein
MRFRSKPVEVDAIQWNDVNTIEEIREFSGASVSVTEYFERKKDRHYLMLRVFNNLICMDLNDWLVRDASGAIGIFDDADFKRHYDRV